MCISPEWEHAAIARGGRVTRFSLSHWLALSPVLAPEQATVHGIELVPEIDIEAGLVGDAGDAEGNVVGANAKLNVNANTSTNERCDFELSEPVLAVDLPPLKSDGDGASSPHCNRL